MPLRIRSADETDVVAIRAAHRRSVLEIAANDYPAEVIAEWGADQSSAAVEKHKAAVRSGNEIVWVAEINGKIEGFSALVPSENELRAVYVTGTAARCGVGRALLQVLEAKAREFGLLKLQMHSSVTARLFYEKCGYKNLGPDVHTLNSGREMDCFFMEKIF
jgi:putative acetyltransferase